MITGRADVSPGPVNGRLAYAWLDSEIPAIDLKHGCGLITRQRFLNLGYDPAMAEK